MIEFQICRVAGKLEYLRRYNSLAFYNNFWNENQLKIAGDVRFQKCQNLKKYIVYSFKFLCAKFQVSDIILCFLFSF